MSRKLEQVPGDREPPRTITIDLAAAYWRRFMGFGEWRGQIPYQTPPSVPIIGGRWWRDPT